MSNTKTTIKSSKVVILSGFIAVLVLLALLTVTAIISISSSIKNLDDVVKDHEHVVNINTMLLSARNRALNLYHMLAVSDPFIKDDILQQFQREAARFIQARKELLKNTKLQFVFWNELKNQVTKASQLQNKTAELIINEQYALAKELLLTEVIPTQDKIAYLLAETVNHKNNLIKVELQKAQYLNNQFYFYILFLGISALLIGIVITYYVYSNIIKTENALHLQQELSETANRAKSEFLANMSHEIRTPLTAIIGFTGQILNKRNTAKEQEKINKTIIRNSLHLQNLINDILDLSKIEAGQLLIELTATSPMQITSEIESTISKQAFDKGLSFKVFNEFPLPVSIITDPIRLKQILLNLCSNAIKFTNKGDIKLLTHYNELNNEVIFTVKDTGIGISNSAQEKIFNPFTQSDASTTRKYGGTGLGLSISSLLAAKLNGKLTCKSELRMGSEFTLSLATGISGNIKMSYSMQEPPSLQKVHNPNSIPKKLIGKILLAEDVKDNQELISLFVAQTGADLYIVENGLDAVDKAISEDFDLILMDMQMPKMDGLTAIKKLRDANYNMPIVSLTANAMKSDRDSCLQAGANNFLAKPIIQDQFFAILNFYLKEDKDAYAKDNYTDEPARDKNDVENFNKNLTSLSDKFIKKLPTIITQMKIAAKENNWNVIEKLSHNLKGIGTTFGYPEISEIAELLNNALNENQIHVVADLVAELDLLCNKIKSSKKSPNIHIV